MRIAVRIIKKNRVIAELVHDDATGPLGAAVGVFLDRFRQDQPDESLLDDEVKMVFDKVG